MRRGLGTSGTTLNIPTFESLGCQKVKRKSKKWKTYLKKKMKENFPILAKEIDWQVQEAQTVPKKLDPRTPKTPKDTKAHHGPKDTEDIQGHQGTS